MMQRPTRNNRHRARRWWRWRRHTYARASVFWTGFQDKVTVLLNDGGLWNKSCKSKSTHEHHRFRGAGSDPAAEQLNGNIPPEPEPRLCSEPTGSSAAERLTLMRTLMLLVIFSATTLILFCHRGLISVLQLEETDVRGH